MVFGSGTYGYGDTVMIRATAAQGFRFASWNDGNHDNPRMIVVRGDATYYAYFEAAVGIEDAEEANIMIYAKNDNIVVRGAEQQDIRVYDAVGKCLYSIDNNTQAYRTFLMPASGVYMVKVGDRTAKRVLIMK